MKNLIFILFMIKNISFLRRLFSSRKDSDSLDFSEEILGSRAKRKVFAKFWNDNEGDCTYLAEVLIYLEGQKNSGKDLGEFRRGIFEIISFFKTCYEEELIASKKDSKSPDFVARF